MNKVSLEEQSMRIDNVSNDLTVYHKTKADFMLIKPRTSHQPESQEVGKVTAGADSWQGLGEKDGLIQGKEKVGSKEGNISGYRDVTGRELSANEVRLLLELKQMDQKVRQHEMAHIAAGGAYVRGGARYAYKIGPDGRRYAVSGEVSIDTSKEPDPQDTIKKMRVVERAALAPADPSPQDRAVAAQAAAKLKEAQIELMELQQARQEGQAVGVAGATQGERSNFPQGDKSDVIGQILDLLV